jgi:hypothetical protein
MTKSVGSPRKLLWPLILLGCVGVFVVFLVVAGLASNATPATLAASKPAQSANPTPSVTPTPTPTAAAGALRQAHTVRTELDDIALVAGQCHVITVNASAGNYLPDQTCTPGAVDPAVTEATIGSTICVSGYTTSVRPSTSVTGPEKTASLLDYGMTAGPTIEYDHLVPLELGGASSVSNLWPEPNKATAAGVNNPKDVVETALKKAVCNHTVQLAAAQAAMASNWITAESTLGLG